MGTRAAACRFVATALQESRYRRGVPSTDVRQPLSLRRGLTAGFVLTLMSSVTIGANAESFWGPFLTALAFSSLCVGLTTWIMIVARRRHPVD